MVEKPGLFGTIIPKVELYNALTPILIIIDPNEIGLYEDDVDETHKSYTFYLIFELEHQEENIQNYYIKLSYFDNINQSILFEAVSSLIQLSLS